MPLDNSGDKGHTSVDFVIIHALPWEKAAKRHIGGLSCAYSPAFFTTTRPANHLHKESRG
jgi:hypothetical protein